MPVDDLVELKVTPQPMGEPDVAEGTSIGPSHRFQADSYDVGIVRQYDVFVVGKHADLTSVSLPVVKYDATLPAAFLVVVELAEIGDEPLSGPGLGADTFHQVPSRETAG